MRVLVIGGTGTIGRGIVETLSAAGQEVAYTFHNQKPNLPGKAIELDLNDPVPELIDVMAYDPDAVVFCASPPVSQKILTSKKIEEFQKLINFNIKPMLELFKIFEDKKMKYIVVLTDYVIGTPPIGLSDYVTSKYALLGLCKCAAVELAKSNGTQVNMVSPGMTESNFISGVPESFKESYVKNNPLRRLGKPEDVSKAVKFLLDSDYCNGENIVINGGANMR